MLLSAEHLSINYGVKELVRDASVQTVILIKMHETSLLILW